MHELINKALDALLCRWTGLATLFFIAAWWQSSPILVVIGLLLLILDRLEKRQ